MSDQSLQQLCVLADRLDTDDALRCLSLAFANSPVAEQTLAQVTEEVIVLLAYPGAERFISLSAEELSRSVA